MAEPEAGTEVDPVPKNRRQVRPVRSHPGVTVVLGDQPVAVAVQQRRRRRQVVLQQQLHRQRREVVLADRIARKRQQPGIERIVVATEGPVRVQELGVVRRGQQDGPHLFGRRRGQLLGQRHQRRVGRQLTRGNGLQRLVLGWRAEVRVVGPIAGAESLLPQLLGQPVDIAETGFEVGHQLQLIHRQRRRGLNRLVGVPPLDLQCLKNAEFRHQRTAGRFGKPTGRRIINRRWVAHAVGAQQQPNQLHPVIGGRVVEAVRVRTAGLRDRRLRHPQRFGR